MKAKKCTCKWHTSSVRCLALSTTHAYIQAITDWSASYFCCILISVVTFSYFAWHFRIVRPTRNHRFNCRSASISLCGPNHMGFFDVCAMEWNATIRAHNGVETFTSSDFEILNQRAYSSVLVNVSDSMKPVANTRFLFLLWISRNVLRESVKLFCILHRSKHALPCNVSYSLNHFLFMFSHSVDDRITIAFSLSLYPSFTFALPQKNWE